MFNLFKSPEEKLEQEMFKSIKRKAFSCLKESGMERSPLEGTVLISCIKDAEKNFLERTIDVSRKHGIPKEKAISIIENSAQRVRNEYIKY